MDAEAHWSTQAQCSQEQPDALFVEGAEQNRAKRLCAGCPVKADCLAEALDHQIEWGVWGGLTERERRGLLRQFPNVTSWRRLIDHDSTIRDVRLRMSA